MSPGFGEVGVKVCSLSGTSDVLVGGKDLLSESSSIRLGEVENTEWSLSFLLGLLSSVVGVNGSHEDIIIISAKSGWDNSIVNTSSDFTGLTWKVIGSLDEIIIGIRVG